MSTQVIRIEGYSKGSLTCIGNECDRTPGIEHRNSDINAERTPLNMSYKDVSQGSSFYTEHGQLLSSMNATFTDKKNGIAFEGMLITSDLDFFKSLGYDPDVTYRHKGMSPVEFMKAKPMPKAVTEYFDKCYKWALEQIGYNGTDKNIISAKVHFDEKTPHMHIYYLPVTSKWQEKVYEKDEDGKVKRTEKGTPIQAKDEKGKTIYRQVENTEQPKLSRTEFWRTRGGKSSYRQMQDSFHTVVGKEYGLERGEVGSDRKHETKYQHKEKELKQQLRIYSDLKVRTDRVDVVGKEIPLTGQTMVKTDDLKKIKQQAKGYAVNRDALSTLRKDQSQLEREKEELRKAQEQLAAEQEKLAAEQLKVQQMYDRQLNLNRLLKSSEQDVEFLHKTLAKVRTENSTLQQAVKELEEKLGDSATTLSGAYRSLANVVKACGMLKYDDGKYKVSGLSEEQSRLIDAIADYGSAWAKEDGFPSLAKEMQEKVSISEGIQDYIKALMPTKSRGRGGPCL